MTFKIKTVFMQKRNHLRFSFAHKSAPRLQPPLFSHAFITLTCHLLDIIIAFGLSLHWHPALEEVANAFDCSLFLWHGLSKGCLVLLQRSASWRTQSDLCWSSSIGETMIVRGAFCSREKMIRHYWLVNALHLHIVWLFSLLKFKIFTFAQNYDSLLSHLYSAEEFLLSSFCALCTYPWHLTMHLN